jgi:hypothetical protein
VMSGAASASSSPPFISQFSKLKTIASTVPGNGDVNPYGVAVVRINRGKLRHGDILVSNFNNSANLQAPARRSCRSHRVASRPCLRTSPAPS